MTACSDAVLLDFLRRKPFVHLFELCDADPAFSAQARFHVADPAAIREVVLVWTGTPTPTLVALVDQSADEMRALLAMIAPSLPDRVHTHISEPLAIDGFSLSAGTPFIRMGLVDPGAAGQAFGECGPEVEPLQPRHAEETRAFFDAHHPGHWFEPSALLRGPYFGIREQGRLVSVAGIHACSRVTNAAVLGNILTAPDRRGRGLARRTTAAVCAALGPATIGLNVKADNLAALACYRRLGFEPVTTYLERSASRSER